MLTDTGPEAHASRSVRSVTSCSPTSKVKAGSGSTLECPAVDTHSQLVIEPLPGLLVSMN
jgi:hypothetical protein